MYKLFQETRSIFNIIFSLTAPSGKIYEDRLITITGDGGSKFTEEDINRYLSTGHYATRIHSVVEYSISEFEYMFISLGNPKGVVGLPIFKLGTNAKIPYEEALVLSGCLLARGLVEIDFNHHILYPTFELMTLVNDVAGVLKNKPDIFSKDALGKAVRATALVTRV